MKKSFSLAITLWISAVLMGFSIYFISISKKTLNNTIDLNTKLSTFIQTKSIYEQIKFFIGTGISKTYFITNNSYPLVKKLYLDSTPIDINNTKIIIQDSAGMISSMYINSKILKSIFASHKFKTAIIASNSLHDWLDYDDFTSIEGAEKDFYIQNKDNYVPRNKNFIAFSDELLDIRGWNNIYQKISKNFIFAPQPIYNIFTMSNQLLKDKYNLSNDIIKKLNSLKKEGNTKEYMNVFYKNASYNYNVDMTFPSRTLKIYISTNDKNISSSITQIIDFTKFKILY